jgi:hypothetical protein
MLKKESEIMSFFVVTLKQTTIELRIFFFSFKIYRYRYATRTNNSHEYKSFFSVHCSIHVHGDRIKIKTK